MEPSSSNTYTKDNKNFYKDSQEFKIYNEPTMDLHQLIYFKQHLEDETKFLIFKILRRLPTDVHYPILEAIDRHVEWEIIRTLQEESSYEYESSECSDPEEEYERRLIKQFRESYWYPYYSEGETTD